MTRFFGVILISIGVLLIFSSFYLSITGSNLFNLFLVRIVIEILNPVLIILGTLGGGYASSSVFEFTGQDNYHISLVFIGISCGFILSLIGAKLFTKHH